MKISKKVRKSRDNFVLPGLETNENIVIPSDIIDTNAIRVYDMPFGIVHNFVEMWKTRDYIHIPDKEMQHLRILESR